MLLIQVFKCLQFNLVMLLYKINVMFNRFSQTSLTNGKVYLLSHFILYSLYFVLHTSISLFDTVPINSLCDCHCSDYTCWTITCTPNTVWRMYVSHCFFFSLKIWMISWYNLLLSDMFLHVNCHIIHQTFLFLFDILWSQIIIVMNHIQRYWWFKIPNHVCLEFWLLKASFHWQKSFWKELQFEIMLLAVRVSQDWDTQHQSNLSL